MTPPHELNFRNNAHALAFDRVLTMLAKEWPGQTDAQRKATALIVAEVIADWGKPGDDEVRWQIQVVERNPDHSELFRAVPTPRETEAALVRARGITEPAARLDLFREVNKMTADERLAATAGIDMSNLPSATAPAATAISADVTPSQRARGVYTVEDAELEKRGYNMHGLLPLKRQELRALVAKELAAPRTPAIAEAKAKIAAGRTWSQLSPTDRANCQREAEAAKKTLRDFGLGGGA